MKNRPNKGYFSSFDFHALEEFMPVEDLIPHLKESFEKVHAKFEGLFYGKNLITHKSLLQFASENLSNDCVRLFKVKDGIQSELVGIDKYNYVSKNKKELVIQELHENSALIISKPELYFEQFQQLIDAFKLCFGCEATGSLIHSPGQTVPTSVHHDSYHVFVIQISGKKDWKIFNSSDNLNAYRDGLSNRLTYTSRSPVQLDEFTLAKNDILYIPPGLYHHVINSYDEDSIHISITVRLDRYISVFERLVQNILVRMSYEADNRGAFDPIYQDNNNIFQQMKIQLCNLLDESISSSEYMQCLQEKNTTEKLLNVGIPFHDICIEDDMDVTFTWINFPNLVKYEYNNQVSVYFEHNKSIVFDSYLWELVSLHSTFLLVDIKSSIHFEERWLAVIQACSEDYGAFRITCNTAS
ncbi:MAG: hypothetical protein CMP47_02945 [Rickettsiales bacterium]|nr:hypothetical protein [Rickettsiales bacterium]